MSPPLIIILKKVYMLKKGELLKGGLRPSYELCTVITNMQRELKNLKTENIPPGFCNLVLFQADFGERIALKLENPEGTFSVLRFLNSFCIFVITTSYDIHKEVNT